VSRGVYFSLCGYGVSQSPPRELSGSLGTLLVQTDCFSAVSVIAASWAEELSGSLGTRRQQLYRGLSGPSGNSRMGVSQDLVASPRTWWGLSGPGGVSQDMVGSLRTWWGLSGPGGVSQDLVGSLRTWWGLSGPGALLAILIALAVVRQVTNQRTYRDQTGWESFGVGLAKLVRCGSAGGVLGVSPAGWNFSFRLW